MNIVMLSTKFSLVENDPWLTNELAEALQEMGHSVAVVNLDWSAKPGDSERRLVTSKGVQVTSIAPVLVASRIPLISRVLKWGASSLRALKVARQQFKDSSVDLYLGFSPAVTMASPILWLATQRKARSFFILWDFFPHHQRQIGLISSPLIFALSKWLENFLFRRFDHIGCMSPANERYLRSHYSLRSDQRVHLLPIWGKDADLPEFEREAVRRDNGLPLESKIVVFGGQLVHGRGLEDLLSMARVAHQQGLSTHFLIMGSGVLENLVTDYLAEGNGNVTWIARIPRNEYLKVAGACDVALVCTVRDVDVPSFPSKTIDYLRLGLPIVASVEKTTDFGDFLAEQGVGVGVEAGQPEVLLGAIESLLVDQDRLNAMSARGPECFQEHFEVRRVASQLLDYVRHTVS